jgi:hypothetical protein
MVEVGKLAIKWDEDLGALTETGSDRFDRRRDHGNTEGRAAQQGAGIWTPENTCSMFFRANRTATDLSPQRPHEMSELGVQERRANLLTLPDSLEASVSRAKHQAPSTTNCAPSLCALYIVPDTPPTRPLPPTRPHPHRPTHTHTLTPTPTSTYPNPHLHPHPPTRLHRITHLASMQSCVPGAKSTWPQEEPLGSGGRFCTRR